MAKHDDKGRKKAERARGPIEAAASAAADVVESVAGAVGEALGRIADQAATEAHHRPAGAHGRAATVDASLPATRDELLERHADARRRRAAAPLGSEAYRRAADEIGRIEVRIAAIERAVDPPRG